MRPSRRTITPAAVLLPIALVAVLGWPDGCRAQVGPFPELAADAPAETGKVVECTGGSITRGMRCGVFRVWENRTTRQGHTLDIHFVILDATDPEARANDPILFFTGGPGAPVADAAPMMAQGLGPLRRTRDILLVDLRGIGRSGALNCDVPYPDGFDSRFGAIFDTAQIRVCRDRLAQSADLRQYSTPTSVDDLEELRRWLGYDAVNLFGGSYGTRVVQVYLRRHPDAVRAAVLTGVTPVFRHGYVLTSPFLQQALDRVIEECDRQPECAAAYPDLPGLVDTAFARFDDGPVPVEIQGRTVRFHRADLGYALRGLLYNRAGEVPYRIWQAAHGELDELVEYYVQRTDWVSGTETAAGNHLSVICAEDIDPVTDVELERAAAGTFLQGAVIRAYRAACDVWPEAELPDDFFEPVHSAVPTLLISGGHDPVTPPEGGEAVARTLGNALHLVVPNGGHGSLDDCTLDLVVRFVEEGSLNRLDPSCVAAAPPTRFRLPERRGDRSEQGVATTVILLGTGTPFPDPDRQGPATAVTVGDRFFLFDAGAGVMRQIQAAGLPRSGPEAAFITHLHSDHTLGYPDLLLTTWVMRRAGPFPVIGPPGLRRMTDHVLAAWEEDIRIRTDGLEAEVPGGQRVDVKEIAPAGGEPGGAGEPVVVYDSAGVTVTAIPVHHGSWEHAFAYRVDTPDRAVLITGDMAPPFDSLVPAVRGVDLVVSEVYPTERVAPEDRPGGHLWPEYMRAFHTSGEELGALVAVIEPGTLVLTHVVWMGGSPEEVVAGIRRGGYHGPVVVGEDLDRY